MKQMEDRSFLCVRALLLFGVCFGMLYACWLVEGCDEESRLVPGMTIVGTLGLPMSLLLFFFEMNAWRSVSLLRALYYFVVGSCVSVVVTFVLTMLFDCLPSAMGRNPRLAYAAYVLEDLRPVFSCLFEEIGKTMIIFHFLMHFRRQCYILQGLLIGAAVGAGFAVFESAGYALAGSSSLLSSILLRNATALACHTAWGAIIGGGTMLMANRGVALSAGRPLRYTKLFSPLFWLLFLFVWVLHFAWNLLLHTQRYFTHNIQLAIFTLFIVFLLVWAGRRQFKAEA